MQGPPGSLLPAPLPTCSLTPPIHAHTLRVSVIPLTGCPVLRLAGEGGGAGHLPPGRHGRCEKMPGALQPGGQTLGDLGQVTALLRAMFLHL